MKEVKHFANIFSLLLISYLYFGSFFGNNVKNTLLKTIRKLIYYF